MGGVKSGSAPPGRETARERRRRLRRDNVILRESEALRHFASGMRYDEIAVEMRVASSTAWKLVQDGLKRRIIEDREYVETARAMVVARLERLFETWTPRALGKGLDADLRPLEPSEPAAKVVLGIIDRYVDVTGVRSLKLDLDVHTDGPMTTAEMTATIMATLDRTVEKDRVIEGHLADAGTSLDTTRHGDSKMAPPIILPRERKD